MYGTLWTIPALRDQDCAPYTIEEAETHFTVSRHYARTKPSEWWSAPRRWEHWHAPQSWQWRPKRLSEECQRPAAHVRTVVPSSNIEQRGSTEGFGLLRRVHQTVRHVGSNSERWSVHTRDRKRQRPALNAGARPRALWKNGNRAVPVSGKGRNSNEHLEGFVRLNGDNCVQWTLTSSPALS